VYIIKLLFSQQNGVKCKKLRLHRAIGMINGPQTQPSKYSMYLATPTYAISYTMFTAL